MNSRVATKIIPLEENGGVAKITVSSEDGENTVDCEVSFKHRENPEIKAEVVNKDGKNAVITFVFDDGDLTSADIIISKLMKKYPSVRPSFAIICNRLASAEKKGEGFNFTPEKYSYIPISDSIFSKTQYKYEFWKRAAEVEGVDVLSHSYSHTTEGIESDPEFELKASQAILSELCSADSLCYVMPGVGTISNPEYLKTLDSGTVYIGVRTTGKKVNLASTYNPFRVSSYALARHSTKLLCDATYTTDENSSKELCLAAGIEAWEKYIDDAVNSGGWACFCIHSLSPQGTDIRGKWRVYEEQIYALFKYAHTLSNNGVAWVANFTEASIYYREWKEAKITATVLGESSISVKLECELDSEVFNMPLTVKVSVPKSWTSAKVGESELSISENDDGEKYVYVNVAPSETVTIIK